MNNPVTTALDNRTPACRRSEVPTDVLAALNQGQLETRNLVEWLAVDIEQLLAAILPAVGLQSEAEAILAGYRPVRDEGISRRTKTVGALLHNALNGRTDRDAIFERLATHRSDSVRMWACYSLMADVTTPLAERLEQARRFAADPTGLSVREAAWDSFRPYLTANLLDGIELLGPWVRDLDETIRRCAVEATRPCGVWTCHLNALKANPELGLPLLEPVRADPSRYVQNAVGNWLNDASKSQPDWVQSLCRQWEHESPSPATDYIVRRALRTVRKKGGSQ